MDQLEQPPPARWSLPFTMVVVFGITVAIIAVLMTCIVSIVPMISAVSHPNTRVFIKDGIHLLAAWNPHNSTKSGFVYQTLPRVNRSAMNDSEVTAIWVRIEGASEVELLSASDEILHSSGFKVTDNWVEVVDPWRGVRIEVRTNLDQNWIPLPFDEMEVRRLFGTPDSVQDSFV